MNKLKNVLLKSVLTLILGFIPLIIYAQTISVKGVVTDNNKEPIIGATVIVDGQPSTGALTDIEGKYSLSNINEDAVLIFKYLGLKTETVPVNKRTIIDVTLHEDTKVLDEVVVTALGIKRAEKSLGYAVTEIKGDKLNSNLINPVSALQGKVAGVEISSSDGGLFGSAKIQIRGASTLGKNNQPIYVVDGIILSNNVKVGDPDYSSQPNDFGNELKNLNPDDFESVSVLKGASATALYGSRGLNGAVVITTKSGKNRKGLGIQVSQTFGVDAVTSAPRLQNIYGNGTIAGSVNYGEKDEKGEYYLFDNYRQFPTNQAGVFSLFSDQGVSFGPGFDGREVEYYDETTRPYNAVKNNFYDAYNKGLSSNTNISVSGGNEKTTFYTSLSHKYAQGTLPTTSFSRLSFLGKASHQIVDNIKISAGMSFATSNPKNPQSDIGQNFVNGVWNRSYDPKYLKEKYKGNYGLASSRYGDKYSTIPGRATWWNIYENSNSRIETTVRPSINLEIGFNDWLSLNTEASYNYYFVRGENKVASSDINEYTGGYQIYMSSKKQTNINTNLIFKKDVGNWSFNGFLRGEYYGSLSQSLSMTTNGGLVIPNNFSMSNSKLTPFYDAGISNTKQIYSVAFQAGFGWKDQLYMDITGRNDWSSALVYKNRTGNYSYFYPSINGSWLISSTFRDKLPSWVTFAKVRGSWAQVGNDTNPYRINYSYGFNTYTSENNNYYGLTIPDIKLSNNLKPERKNSWEVGLDWHLFNNRLGFDFTFYKENTTDQIMEISVPYQSGARRELINAGNIQNKGIELAINTTPISTKDFEWNLNFTYTKNENKIVSLYEDPDGKSNYIVLAGNPAYGNYRIGSVAKIGSKYGTLMTDSYTKIDTKSGLPVLRWRDKQRGAYLLRNESDVVEIGSMTPDFLGSISNEIKYKNLKFSVALDMRFGGYVASYHSRYGTAYGFTEQSLYGSPGYGGVTWTSKFDDKEYEDGIIPKGIIEKGTIITQPDGEKYEVSYGGVSEIGESYEELIEKGILEPTHSSFWNYTNNQWTMAGRDYGVVSNDWVKKLNYIALRNVSIGYVVPSRFCERLKVKNLNLTLSGHNLGYLLNTMPSGENPESVSGTAAGEFRVRSFEGVTSSFTFTINATF